jgi:hypothetical protein
MVLEKGAGLNLCVDRGEARQGQCLAAPAPDRPSPRDFQVRRLVRDFGLTLHIAGVIAEHAFKVGAVR